MRVGFVSISYLYQVHNTLCRSRGSRSCKGGCPASSGNPVDDVAITRLGVAARHARTIPRRAESDDSLARDMSRPEESIWRQPVGVAAIRAGSVLHTRVDAKSSLGKE